MKYKFLTLLSMHKFPSPFFFLFVCFSIDLQQHLAPSLAEIIRIPFSFGSTLIHVGSVGLDGHRRHATQRNGRNGHLIITSCSSADGDRRRRRRRCCRISESTE
jgi:hypothetical protein